MKFHEKIRSFRLWLSRLAARLFPRGIYYVSGPETLPPPLSREEEREALDRLSASPGDEQVRGLLIERNLRLVVYIARKFETTGIGIEDLVSIGTMGLIKAIGSFRTEKNIKLATYASRCHSLCFLLIQLCYIHNLHQL